MLRPPALPSMQMLPQQPGPVTVPQSSLAPPPATTTSNLSNDNTTTSTGGGTALRMMIPPVKKDSSLTPPRRSSGAGGAAAHAQAAQQAHASSSTVVGNANAPANANANANANAAQQAAHLLAQQKLLLVQCDWKDKTLWATRQILGGNSINGFLKATATTQRIKKQRARQLALSRKSAAALAAGGAGVVVPGQPPPPQTLAPDQLQNDAAKAASAAASAAGGVNSKNTTAFDQAQEEQLKRDIMNPRTAKKIKAEMEAGLQFCVTLHNSLRSILFEVDPSQAPYLPTALKMEDCYTDTTASATSTTVPGLLQLLAPGTSATAAMPDMPVQSVSVAPAAGHMGGMPVPLALPSPMTGIPSIHPLSSHHPSSNGGAMHHNNMNLQSSSQHDTQKRSSLPKASQPTAQQSQKTTASAGNSTGSTLKRQRKKKLPPSGEPPINLSEFDASGKRVHTKKEHNYRIFEVLRFRSLRQGDFVAARPSSRDLWILARVLKEYPGTTTVAPAEFLHLTDARRDALFREKVLVKDVEEIKDDGGPSNQVARSLVLPLARTYSEAAEWCQRCKKGARVYAMYPQTTSLYSATVIDNTTYCREDDDIIVVEFDGEETGMYCILSSVFCVLQKCSAFFFPSLTCMQLLID
jgi:hypothetical protein